MKRKNMPAGASGGQGQELQGLNRASGHYSIPNPHPRQESETSSGNPKSVIARSVFLRRSNLQAADEIAHLHY